MNAHEWHDAGAGKAMITAIVSADPGRIIAHSIYVFCPFFAHLLSRHTLA